MRVLAVLMVLWLVSPAQAQDITTQPGSASNTPGWTLQQNASRDTSPPAPAPPQHDHTADVMRARYGTANIYVTSRVWGGVIIHINGFINWGDEQKFAHIASRYPAGTLVDLDSRGGFIGPALDIADIISARGFDTMLTVNDEVCASACAYIWLSGRHAVVQQNSLLCFHQGRDATTGQPSPEANEMVARRIQAYGLNRNQAWKLANAAPPENVRCATEWWAAQLGFDPQIVPTFYAMRFCQSKFCLAKP
jgi:membrane-bound ClpP family serine protease